MRKSLAGWYQSKTFGSIGQLCACNHVEVGMRATTTSLRSARSMLVQMETPQSTRKHPTIKPLRLVFVQKFDYSFTFLFPTSESWGGVHNSMASL